MTLCQDRGGRGRALQPSFRPGPGARTPSPAPRKGTRRAVARGLGGLPRGRRVATRHDPYAPRRLNFLYVLGDRDPGAETAPAAFKDRISLGGVPFRRAADSSGASGLCPKACRLRRRGLCAGLRQPTAATERIVAQSRSANRVRGQVWTVTTSRQDRTGRCTSTSQFAPSARAPWPVRIRAMG